MPMPGVRGAPCAVGTGTDRRVWMWGCYGETQTQLEDVVRICGEYQYESTILHYYRR